MAAIVDRLIGLFLFALRMVLKWRYVMLIAAVAALVWWLRPFLPIDGPTYWTFVAVLLAVTLIVDALASTTKSPFYWNFDLKTRRRRIAELLSCCRKSLLIVSGEFSHETFGSQLVLQALNKIPDHVRVELYITEDAVDPESGDFLAWVAQRDLTIGRVTGIAHRIVVDDLNVRVEFRSDGLFGSGRPAMVVYGDPDVAASARQGLNRALDEALAD